jgi:hypothetical protein
MTSILISSKILTRHITYSLNLKTLYFIRHQIIFRQLAYDFAGY